MVTEITMEHMQPGGMPEDDSMHVVMFFGTNCGPCKATMPFYEEAAEYFISKGANIKCHRINAWAPAEQAAYVKETWKVEGVPNFKLFYKGTIVYERSGGGNYDTMCNMIDAGITEVYKQFKEKV